MIASHYRVHNEICTITLYLEYYNLCSILPLGSALCIPCMLASSYLEYSVRFALLRNVFLFQFSSETSLLVLAVGNRNSRQRCYGWARFRHECE